jgi:hypothetical protein
MLVARRAKTGMVTACPVAKITDFTGGAKGLALRDVAPAGPGGT